MADLVLVSDRADQFRELMAGLETGGHRTAAGGFDQPAPGPDPDVLLVDAVKDLARAREHCRMIRGSAGRARIIVVLTQTTLDAIGPDWDADSFVIEGCSAEEVLARLRLLLGSQISESTAVIRVGDLSIDPETYQVRLRGRPLDLTYKEFQLLTFLAQRPGRVFSRSMLLQEVWGYDFFGGTRTVDVHVRRLRAKLGAEHESMIATVRNVGYKIEAPTRRG